MGYSGVLAIIQSFQGQYGTDKDGRKHLDDLTDFEIVNV